MLVSESYKLVKAIKFGILSPETIRRMSVTAVITASAENCVEQLVSLVQERSLRAAGS